MYRKIVKRILDFTAVLILLVVLSPVFFIVYMCLLVINRSNPLFFQKRIGLNNKEFTLVKFRSMTELKDKTGNLLPDEQRLTAFGRFLRKWSIDEIPQLVNVLIGDMSLIGPRPLFECYLPFYHAEERIRHHVRPGISGWAQVNGRNIADWDTRLALDIYYVKNLSFKLDCNIVAKTIVNIILAKDVLVNETETIMYLSEERKTQMTDALSSQDYSK